MAGSRLDQDNYPLFEGQFNQALPALDDTDSNTPVVPDLSAHETSPNVAAKEHELDVNDAECVNTSAPRLKRKILLYRNKRARQRRMVYLDTGEDVSPGDMQRMVTYEKCKQYKKRHYIDGRQLGTHEFACQRKEKFFSDTLLPVDANIFADLNVDPCSTSAIGGERIIGINALKKRRVFFADSGDYLTNVELTEIRNVNGKPCVEGQLVKWQSGKKRKRPLTQLQATPTRTFPPTEDTSLADLVVVEMYNKSDDLDTTVNMEIGKEHPINMQVQHFFGESVFTFWRAAKQEPSIGNRIATPPLQSYIGDTIELRPTKRQKVVGP